MPSSQLYGKAPESQNTNAPGTSLASGIGGVGGNLGNQGQSAQAADSPYANFEDIYNENSNYAKNAASQLTSDVTTGLGGLQGAKSVVGQAQDKNPDGSHVGTNGNSLIEPGRGGGTISQLGQNLPKDPTGYKVGGTVDLGNGTLGPGGVNGGLGASAQPLAAKASIPHNPAAPPPPPPSPSPVQATAQALPQQSLLAGYGGSGLTATPGSGGSGYNQDKPGQYIPGDPDPNSPDGTTPGNNGPLDPTTGLPMDATTGTDKRQAQPGDAGYNSAAAQTAQRDALKAWAAAHPSQDLTPGFDLDGTTPDPNANIDANPDDNVNVQNADSAAAKAAKAAADAQNTLTGAKATDAETTSTENTNADKYNTASDQLTSWGQDNGQSLLQSNDPNATAWDAALAAQGGGRTSLDQLNQKYGNGWNTTYAGYIADQQNTRTQQIADYTDTLTGDQSASAAAAANAKNTRSGFVSGVAKTEADNTAAAAKAAAEEQARQTAYEAAQKKAGGGIFGDGSVGDVLRGIGDIADPVGGLIGLGSHGDYDSGLSDLVTNGFEKFTGNPVGDTSHDTVADNDATRSMPSSMSAGMSNSDWTYYNSLSPQDKKAYIADWQAKHPGSK